MNKIITLVIGVAMSIAAFAQDIRMSDPPTTLSLKPTLVRQIENNHDWRTGLAYELVNFRQGNRPSFATLDAWTLTDAASFDRFYLGAGLSFPIIPSEHITLCGTVGYSADMSSLRKPTRGGWSVGINLGIRF